MDSHVSYGGLAIPTATAMGKELLSWETKNRIPGWRPEDHQYPKMLYKAQKRYDGKVMCLDTPPIHSPLLTPDQHEREVQRVENFNRSCLMTVQSEEEEKKAHSQGWRTSAKLALEEHEKWERMIGDEAARLAHADRNLSEKAKAEREAYEASTPDHVAVIPEARLDKRSKAYRDSQKVA